MWGCRSRNIGFAVVARSNAQVHAAICRVLADEGRWSPDQPQPGVRRPGYGFATGRGAPSDYSVAPGRVRVSG